MLLYLLMGVLVVNMFLNMKLANKKDRRTFRQVKKSLIRYSSMHIKEVFSRKRTKKAVSKGERTNLVS